jgi:hypothetical protein
MCVIVTLYLSCLSCFFVSFRRYARVYFVVSRALVDEFKWFQVFRILAYMRVIVYFGLVMLVVACKGCGYWLVAGNRGKETRNRVLILQSPCASHVDHDKLVDFARTMMVSLNCLLLENNRLGKLSYTRYWLENITVIWRHVVCRRTKTQGYVKHWNFSAFD